MAWETTNVMDQRKRFVLKALDPSSCMAELCREFGIPRKTGYKWVKRFGGVTTAPTGHHLEQRRSIL